MGIKRGGLLLSLLVLPLYVPTLIFGALAVIRGAEGQDATTPLILLAGITLGALAILPFACRRRAQDQPALTRPFIFPKIRKNQTPPRSAPAADGAPPASICAPASH